MTCTCHYEEIDGQLCAVVNPSCVKHAPQAPYISRVEVALKTPAPDRKRHGAHAISERGE